MEVGMKKFVALLMVALILCVGMGAYAQGVGTVQGTLYDSFEENGAQLAVLEASFPQITGLADAAVMDSINEAIRGLILTGGFGAACEYAKDDYAYDPDGFYFGEYGLWVEAYSTLSSSHYFSVVFAITLGTGGAHPSNWREARLYSLSDGKPVGVASLVHDADAFHARIADAVIASIQQNGLAAKYDYWDNYPEIIAERSYEMAPTDEGLLVFFNPYDIAPYSSGVQEFLLEFDQLGGELRNILWPDGSEGDGQ